MKWLEMHLNCPPWLDNFLKLYEMAINTFKLSTMVGEIFEMYMYEMARNAFKLSTMVGEIIEIYMY